MPRDAGLPPEEPIHAEESLRRKLGDGTAGRGFQVRIGGTPTLPTRLINRLRA